MNTIEPEARNRHRLTAVRGEGGYGHWLKEGEGISQRHM